MKTNRTRAVFALPALLLAMSAHAYWPEPRTACTSANLGQQATTAQTYGTYTDYAQYECRASGWYLLGVVRCYSNGRCVDI